MTPCLGPELPQTMRMCLPMMKNMGGDRTLSVPAFWIDLSLQMLHSFWVDFAFMFSTMMM